MTEDNSRPLLGVSVKIEGGQYSMAIDSPLTGAAFVHCCEQVSRALHELAISVVAQDN